MLATNPNSSVPQTPSAFIATVSPAAALLGLIAPTKVSHSSVASTRATSPSSSTTSSDDVAVSQKKPAAGVGELARRRGRNVLMLSELVDTDSEGKLGGSPSTDTTSCTSAVGAASTNSTRCTPCTSHMMSFSPLKTKDTCNFAQRQGPSEVSGDQYQTSFSNTPPLSQVAENPRLSQVAENGVMSTSPLQKSTDASQRSHACASRLGGAAAGGDASQRGPVPSFSGTSAGIDASQRNPVGRVSLGVAIIGGDASQRSPPGSTNRIRPPLPKAVTTGSLGAWVVDCGSAPTAVNGSCTKSLSCSQQGITATCPSASSPDSSRCSVGYDASQRSPARGAFSQMPVDSCNDALKSWLSGTSSNGSKESSIDIAELLRQAAPESYED